MREKLLDLMKNEGLKPSQLAELLGINPAGVSHILAGRNKPGFDLLQKILRRFPRINPDWLLLDSPKMYRDENRTDSGMSADTPKLGPFANGLFDRPDAATLPIAEKVARTNSPQTTPPADAQHPGDFPTASRSGNAAVERVVIFYEDHTFESFTPKL